MTTLKRVGVVAAVAVVMVGTTLVVPSCDERSAAKAPAHVPVDMHHVPVDMNIVVLLDLSDRISPARRPTQAARDVEIIAALVGTFEKRVREQAYLMSRDRLRIAVAQQVGAGYDVAQFADKLTIDMPQIYMGGKPAFDKAKAQLTSEVSDLYAAAAATSHYSGANIPLFFRDHLAGYIEQAEAGRALRNILIIVTDGYVQLDREVNLTRHDEGNRTTDMRLSRFRGVLDWEKRFDQGDHGLIVEKRDAFKGLEVLALEISLDPQHQDDKTLLFKYWLKWLGEMGISRPELDLTEDSLQLTVGRMEKFVRGPVTGH